MQAVTKVAIYAVELLFGLGIVGSALVILLTGIEDLGELAARPTKDEVEGSTSSRSDGER